MAVIESGPGGAVDERIGTDWVDAFMNQANRDLRRHGAGADDLWTTLMPVENPPVARSGR